jgi:predicted nicotinamide N-methyase
MANYSTKQETLHIGSNDFILRSLLNHQQFDAGDNAASEAGIPSSTWALFGVFWPSGIILANIMHTLAIKPECRILEMGCGLALSSIVLQKRGANICASDYHPLANEFLQYNTALNDLPDIVFHTCNWANNNPLLGEFDLLIGSDVLYEPNHSALLCNFIQQHASLHARVMIVDPNRQQQSEFSKKMRMNGYACKSAVISSDLAKSMNYKGKLLDFQR